MGERRKETLKSQGFLAKLAPVSSGKGGLLSLADLGHTPAAAGSELASREKSWVLQFFCHAAVCAILLPVGAQSSLGGLLGLYFLFTRGYSRLGRAWQKPGLGRLQKIWRRFFQMLCAVWLLLFISLLIELAQLRFSWPEAGEAISGALRNIGKWGAYGCLLVWVLQLEALRPKQGPLIKVQWLLIFTGCYALYMVGQRYYGWDIVHGWQARLGENRFAYGVYRGSGLMGHPLTLAYNSMIFCLLSFGQALWLWERAPRQAKLWLAQSGLLLYIIILSGSRYPSVLTVGLLAGGVVLVWKRGRVGRWPLVLSAGLFLIAGAGIVWLDPNLQGRLQETFSADGHLEDRFDRLIFWKVHAQMIAEHPWFGLGLVRYKELLAQYYEQMGFGAVLRKYNAHNIYLQVTAQAGLLGVLSLSAFLFAWWRLGWSFFRQWRHAGLALVAVGTLLGGLMQNTLYDSEYLFALWYGLGLAMSWIIERPGTPARGEGGSLA